MVDGGAFGKDMENICFLGIYKYPTTYNEQNVYYGGALFMQEYYVTLTMDPWEKDNNNKYLLMGIGEKNPDANLGKMQYDPSYA